MTESTKIAYGAVVPVTDRGTVERTAVEASLPDLAEGVSYLISLIDPDPVRWERRGVPGYSKSSLLDGLSISANSYPELIPILSDRTHRPGSEGLVPGQRGRYVDNNGRRSNVPVNGWPYVQDYRLALSALAHEAVSTPEPKLMQILASGSRDIHPDHAHNNTSAHAYGGLMDWVRGAIGMVWLDIGEWETLSLAIANPIYTPYKTLVDRRIGQIDLSCGAASWVRRLHMKVNYAIHRPLLAAGAIHAIDRTMDPWGAGALIGSKSNEETVDDAFNRWTAGFKAAVEYYDENNIGSVKPRDLRDRPIYIPAHFFPHQTVVYH